MLWRWWGRSYCWHQGYKTNLFSIYYHILDCWFRIESAINANWACLHPLWNSQVNQILWSWFSLSISYLTPNFLCIHFSVMWLLRYWPIKNMGRRRICGQLGSFSTSFYVCFLRFYFLAFHLILFLFLVGHLPFEGTNRNEIISNTVSSKPFIKKQRVWDQLRYECFDLWFIDLMWFVIE